MVGSTANPREATASQAPPAVGQVNVTGPTTNDPFVTQRTLKAIRSQITRTCSKITSIIQAGGSRGAIQGLVNHAKSLLDTAFPASARSRNNPSQQQSNYSDEADAAVEALQQLELARRNNPTPGYGREDSRVRRWVEEQQLCRNDDSTPDAWIDLYRDGRLQTIRREFSGRHPLETCAQFKELTSKDRLLFCMRHKLCFNCFATHHTSRECKIKKHCNVTGDSTLFREGFIRKLRLDGTPHTLSVDGAGGVRSKYASRQEVTLNGSTLPTVASPAPVLEWSTLRQRWKHLRDLPLQSSGGRVDILLGSDQAHFTTALESRIGKEFEPTAIFTRLGWIVRGVVGDGLLDAAVKSHAIFAADEDVDVLAQQMRRLCDSEEFGTEHQIPGMSESERQAVQILEAGTRKLDVGYEKNFKMGYAVYVEDASDGQPEYYLAHHGVKKGKKWRLNGFEIPRCLFEREDFIIRTELHSFGDASEEAYAAVVYLRNVYRDTDTCNVCSICFGTFGRKYICMLEIDNSLRRSQWNLGRVTKTYPGDDGLVHLEARPFPFTLCNRIIIRHQPSLSKNTHIPLTIRPVSNSRTIEQQQ
ncbi:hypothetical protein GHT06_021533 [Daphnia sinensis]|uniref:Uncharacterized protein n=1 Tax=Daphnia sinensis TaxID=1820382 RepID=A0AAD5KJ92_9CRUS|nr:hypothetical protein GHT06_021533 [Daphnia sinensis]